MSITSGAASELPDMLIDQRVQLAVLDRPKRYLPLASHTSFWDRFRFFVSTASAGTRNEGRNAQLIVVPDARDELRWTHRLELHRRRDRTTSGND